MDVVSLFSGVGGIDLGFERAGMTTRLLCEIDKHARAVLAHRFPGVPIHPDVTELTADDLRAAGAVPSRTVLVAGFPCQDLSVAGARRGMGRESGTRSALFWQVDRILAEFRPAWVVLENVPGLLSSHGGRDMGAVLGALADRGYGFAYRVLDAQFFGVPQRRRRVVIVGHLGAPWTAPAEVLFEPESGAGDSAAVGGSREGAAADAGRGVVAALAASGVGTCGADDNQAQAGHLVVSPVLARGYKGVSDDKAASGHLVVTTLGDHTHALTAEGHDASEDGTGRGTPIIAATLTEVRRLTPKECERLQGHPDDWTAGQSDSQRYKQLGNGVAVPVFEWVAARLIAQHEQIAGAA